MAVEWERLPEDELVRIEDIELLAPRTGETGHTTPALHDDLGRSRLTDSFAWRSFKRLADLAICVLAIAVTLPFMALIALAVKIGSPGPVFFVHRRVARGGDEFGVLKFRTMVCDAEVRLEAHLHVNAESKLEWDESFKLRDDPRLTKVGRILRKWSLDELPQLFNILLGHMSVVGPRPIVREEISRFGDYAHSIIAVKPGLTGLWAVSGRNDVSKEQRALLEYGYVTDWSPMLDLRILLRTIPAVLRRDGAY